MGLQRASILRNGPGLAQVNYWLVPRGLGDVRPMENAADLFLAWSPYFLYQVVARSQAAMATI